MIHQSQKKPNNPVWHLLLAKGSPPTSQDKEMCFLCIDNRRRSKVGFFFFFFSFPIPLCKGLFPYSTCNTVQEDISLMYIEHKSLWEHEIYWLAALKEYYVQLLASWLVIYSFILNHYLMSTRTPLRCNLV